MPAIENPNPVVAAAADPSRHQHTLRSWYETYLFYDGNPPNVAGVARAEPVQRSRLCFIHFVGAIHLLLVAISVSLMVIQDQLPMARPLRVAAIVVGSITLFLGVLSAHFVVLLILALSADLHPLQKFLDPLL
jgi:hypothetical protein